MLDADHAACMSNCYRKVGTEALLTSIRGEIVECYDFQMYQSLARHACYF
jgi:hypothetical protein